MFIIFIMEEFEWMVLIRVLFFVVGCLVGLGWVEIVNFLFFFLFLFCVVVGILGGVGVFCVLEDEDNF